MKRISSRAFGAELLGGIVPVGIDSFQQSEGLVDWCVRNRVTVEGRPLDFLGRPWLVDVYNDRYQHVVLSKATQVGGSVWAIIRCLHLANTVPGWRGWVYFFPSRTDVVDFSQSRVQPLIAENDVLQASIGEVDKVGVRQVGTGYLYFRGMRSTTGMKCVSEATELLTRSGWKPVLTVTVDDEVATRSPTGRFMWQKPTHVWRYAPKGGVGVMCFRANGLDVEVTDEHRMLLTYRAGTHEWFELARDCRPASDAPAFVRGIKSWKGEYPQFLVNKKWGQQGGKWFFDLPTAQGVSRRVSLENWVAFLGIWLSDGTVAGVSGGKRGNAVTISQVEHSKKFDDIRRLLARLRLGKWGYYRGLAFVLTDKPLADLLFSLGNQRVRRIPEWVKNLPSQYLEILWEWLLKGDGHTSRKGQRTYATISPELAGDIQEILIKCGRNASVLKRRPATKLPWLHGREVRSTTPVYIVSERRSVISEVPKATRKKVQAVGCVSVPNGVVLTRLNGYTIWSGNSVPADGIVFDELDEATEEAKAMAKERLASSLMPYTLELSNPSIPQYGIDLAFGGNPEASIPGSDQRHWHIRCPCCNAWTAMELEFPQELGLDDLRVIRPRESARTMRDHHFRPGSWYRACVKCGSEIDPRIGQWVRKHEDEYLPHGYLLSQLYSPTIDPASIAADYVRTRHPHVFYNLKIGIAWIAASDRLTLSDVLRWCSDRPMRESNPGPCTMGVDTGNDLHVVISRDSELENFREYVHIGVYPHRAPEDWAQLDDLMRRYNVRRCVVDANPHTQLARSFALRHKGRVYLNYYVEERKGRTVWNENDLVVQENRTEAIDAARMLFRDHSPTQVILPRREEILESFARQCTSLVKKREEDDDGTVRYVYVRTADDHWMHAFVYDGLCHLADVSPAKNKPARRGSFAAMGQAGVIQTGITNPNHPEYGR